MATVNEEFVKRWYGSPTVGNSNVISRNYLDSLLIETRYMNSGTPSTEFTLYGETFASPIMSAALSHIDHFMYEGAADSLVRGVVAANAAFWYGMAPDGEIERFVSAGARVIEIIKPFADRDKIYKKIEHAEKCGVLAVGIDIDHVFANDGSPCICFGEELRALTTAELADICRASKLPVIAKGVLSAYENNPAIRFKLREKTKQLWSDPSFREKCSAGRREVCEMNFDLAHHTRAVHRQYYASHPERREEISRQMRVYLSDPANRAFVDADPRGKPVVCVETGVVYPSQLAAEKATGFTGIHKVCRGRQYTAGGYHWRYATEKE